MAKCQIMSTIKYGGLQLEIIQRIKIDTTIVSLRITHFIFKTKKSFAILINMNFFNTNYQNLINPHTVYLIFAYFPF
jgi:hypothetical protein